MIEDPKKKEDLLILYGSQTGTAEDVATRLARDAIRLGLTPCVRPMGPGAMKDISNWTGPNNYVLSVVCTTGQGDPPDSMKEFWKEICRVQWGPDFYKDLNYGIIALGDSSYEKYNFVGKKLFRRLQQLGGNPILDLCLGDDQHDLGYHSAVNPWVKKLWEIICESTGLSSTNGNDVEFTKFCLEYGLHQRNSEMSRTMPEFYNTVSGGGSGMTMELRMVVGNERVTASSHWQDTRLISVDLKGSKLKFEPGDVLTVQPRNLPENVDKFFEIFPELVEAGPFFLYYNTPVHWSNLPQEILHGLGPQPWKWREVVTHLLDIQSVPRISFFELMSKIATNELEKERLSEFCTPEGQDDLLNYCNRPKRNILEVLQDFPNTTKEIPHVSIFDIIPVIKSRSFSIASSNRLFPDKLQILVAVVEYQTKIKNKRKGLCSNWLANHCPEGTMIPVWIQRGSFNFPPSDEDAAVIMIGPGTGVAPFRSIITERLDSWEKILFFGCRNENSDFYFRKEWESMEKNNCLKLFTAFSRNEDGSKQDYVQDVIVRESEELRKIFSSSKKFYIFIAGNAKQMPKDVQVAISEVMEQSGIENPLGFIDLCAKKLGRYQTETWS